MKYTYLIGWKTLDKWYYGRRTANVLPPEQDFWHVYKTSSKHVKKLIEDYGDPDIKEIRKIFDTKEQTVLWEEKVLQRMKCVKSDRWINKNDQKNFCGEGETLSEETKKKISKAKKGKQRTEETKEKIRNSLKGRIFSEEWKQKISESGKGERNSSYGKPRSDETKKKISETMKRIRQSQRDIRNNVDV